MDGSDNVWVVANQADEIVVVDPSGKGIAKLGVFNGIGADGAPVGFLFPASLVLRGQFVYVTNLSLDLRLFNPAFNAVDSQYAAQVTVHTVARIANPLASSHCALGTSTELNAQSVAFGRRRQSFSRPRSPGRRAPLRPTSCSIRSRPSTKTSTTSLPR